MSIIFDPQPKTYWPKSDEVYLSDDFCPNCDHILFRSECSDCGGEGGHDGYEEDPLWYDEGDTIPCDVCGGHGYHHWCPRCHWDMLVPKSWNTLEARGLALNCRRHFFGRINNQRIES